MKILVFDTETTGLYNKKITDISKQPHVIQWASILVEMGDDGEYSEISRSNILIKPPIPVPFETSKIHNIYDIDLIGKPSFKDVVEGIKILINDSDAIVGHNVEFDENMLKTEFTRVGVDYKPKQSICTMNESINYCRLPKKGTTPGYKRPKLQELSLKCTGEYFTGAHDAIVDVEATLKCLSHLVKWGVIKLKEDAPLTLF